MFKLISSFIRQVSLWKLALLLFTIGIAFAFFHQVVVVSPQINSAHPYSDALVYQNLAMGHTDFFGPTHITHRVFAPFVAGVISKSISIPVQWSFALIQLLLLAVVLYRVNKVHDYYVLLFFSLILLSLPAFWRGFFLPMSDTFLWGFLTLFWLEINRKKSLLSVALFTLILAFLSKEMAVLVLLFLLFSKVEQKKSAFLLSLIALLVWAAMEFFNAKTGIAPNNYLFHAEHWLQDFEANLTFEKMILWPKYLLSGFSLLLFFWVYRFFMNGKKTFFYLMPEILLTLILFAFAPENAPRLLFPFTGMMVMRLVSND